MPLLLQLTAHGPCQPCSQLQEQLAFDARMHIAVDEMGSRLAEEADAQVLERKRWEAAASQRYLSFRGQS